MLWNTTGKPGKANFEVTPIDSFILLYQQGGKLLPKLFQL